MMKSMLKQSLLFSLIAVFTIPACSGGFLRDAIERRKEAREGREEKTNLPAGVESRSVNVNGVQRNYLLYVPKTYSGKPTSLVLVFHGGAGNAEHMMGGMSNWNNEAERRGWLVAYPNGSGKRKDKLLTWNAGRCCGYAQERNVDDVGFAKVMLDDIGRRVKVDSSRVFATGISNGAMMAYRLACDLSDRIAAIAPVSGTQEDTSCTPARPVSIMHFHGTADRNVPFEGGYGDNAVIKMDKRSVPSTLDEWRAHNHCRTMEKVRVEGDSTFTRAACAQSTEVVLVKIEGGGHAWPGGKETTRSGATSSRYINATQEMAEFFEKHGR